MVNKDFSFGIKFYGSSFLYHTRNNKTFSLWKLGFWQTDLTVTMIISCFVCEYPKFVYAPICSETINIYVPGKNINHPNVAYFKCVLGFEVQLAFPVCVYI